MVGQYFTEKGGSESGEAVVLGVFLERWGWRIGG